MQLQTSGFRILFTPHILLKHLGSQTTDSKWLENSIYFTTNGKRNFHYLHLKQDLTPIV